MKWFSLIFRVQFLLLLYLWSGFTAALGQELILSPSRTEGVPVDTVRINELIKTAEHLTESGERRKVDSALVVLKGAVGAAPNYAPALAALAETHAFRTDHFNLNSSLYDTAVAYAERLVSIDASQGWLHLGRIYGLKGEQGFAVEALNQSLKADSLNSDALFWLGYRYFDIGRHDLGIPLQARVMKLRPQDRATRNLLGFSYIHIGKPELAQVPFDQSSALRLTGFSAGGHLMIHLAQGNFKGAIDYAENVLQRYPETEWAWSRLGEAQFFAGLDDQAVRSFEEALARDSASTNIYTWKSTALPLAYLYMKNGRTTEAAPLIKRSYEHSDAMMLRGQEPWNVYYHYAVLALMDKRREDALRWLRAAHSAGMPGRVFIETDPLLEDLHGEAEFEDIVQRLRWREEEIQRRLKIEE